MLLLAVTGAWLHFPGFSGPYGLAIFLHLVLGYALFPTLGARVYWAFFGRGDPGEPLRVIAAGGGLRLLGHYAVYLLTWIVLAALVVTGLVLRFPTSSYFTPIVSSLGSTLGVRIVHYIFTWLLVAAVAVHAYQTFLWRRRGIAQIFLPPPVEGSGGVGR